MIEQWLVFLEVLCISGSLSNAGVVVKNQKEIDLKVFRICRQKPPSQCRENRQAFYFDIQLGTCTLFNYGKCAENADSDNNFESLNACQTSCGDVPSCPPASVLPPPAGCKYDIVSEPDYVLPYCPYPKLTCPNKIGEVSDFHCLKENKAEEETYSLSCEFLLDSLYDLEMDALADEGSENTENELNDKPKARKRRQTKAVKDLLERTTKTGKTLTQLVEEELKGSSDFDEMSQSIRKLPFYPRPDIPEDEEIARKKVCNSLIQLPGVKKRFCTTLSHICPHISSTIKTAVENKGGPATIASLKGVNPEGQPDPIDLSPPPGKPPPPRGNGQGGWLGQLGKLLGLFGRGGG